MLEETMISMSDCFSLRDPPSCASPLSLYTEMQAMQSASDHTGAANARQGSAPTSENNLGRDFEDGKRSE